MASPQTENGSTMIANEILEKLYSFPFTAREFKVLFFVIRKTWGWHKTEDHISYNQIADACSVTRRNAIYTVNSLVLKQALVITKGYINTIKFNKDYDKWLVPEITPPSVGTGTTLVSEQALKLVPSLTPTKDNKYNITKENNTNVLEKQVSRYGDQDINEVSSYFLKVFEIPKEDCSIRQSRQYWKLLLNDSRKGVFGVKWLIDLARKDQFWAVNITSSKDLYYKRIKIISRTRKSGLKIAVMGGGELK